MILRSCLLIIFLSFNFFILTNLLFADDPMSAIDWLEKKINDPLNFLLTHLKLKKVMITKLKK